MLRRNADFFRVCVASSGNSPVESKDKLEGSLFIISSDSVEIQNILNLIDKEFDKIQQCNANKLNIEEILKNKENLIRDIRSHCDFYCDFNLSRLGIAELKVPDNLSDEVSSNAPTYPTNEDLKKERFHNVSSQLFFFLKDLVHSHAHHADSMDTMVDLYDTTNPKDDYEWRCETLRVLQRKVLEYKRTIGGGNNNHNSAVGIMAYMKSFIRISKEQLDDQELEPKWNTDLMEESIRAKYEAHKIDLQEKIRSSEKLRNWIILTLSIFFPFIMLMTIVEVKIDEADVSPILIIITKLVLKSPHQALFLILMIVFSLWLISDKRKIWRNWKLVKEIVRFITPFKKKTGGFVLVVLGCSLFYFVIKYVIPIL